MALPAGDSKSAKSSFITVEHRLGEFWKPWHILVHLYILPLNSIANHCRDYFAMVIENKALRSINVKYLRSARIWERRTYGSATIYACASVAALKAFRFWTKPHCCFSPGKHAFLTGNIGVLQGESFAWDYHTCFQQRVENRSDSINHVLFEGILSFTRS